MAGGWAAVAPGTPGFLVACVAAYLVLASVVAFALFGWDKRCAEAGAWRVPERALLRLALLGGWPGAKLAQLWFRHKTRKQPFARQLNAIGALQAAALAAVLLAGPAMEHDLAGRAMAQVGAWRDAVVGPVTEVAGGDTAPAAEAAPQPVMPRRFGPGSGG